MGEPHRPTIYLGRSLSFLTLSQYLKTTYLLHLYLLVSYFQGSYSVPSCSVNREFFLEIFHIQFYRAWNSCVLEIIISLSAASPPGFNEIPHPLHCWIRQLRLWSHVLHRRFLLCPLMNYLPYVTHSQLP